MAEMSRQSRASLLSQCFAALLSAGSLVRRERDHLVVDLGDISPFSLVTSVFNSIGRDPVVPIMDVQDSIHRILDLFNAQGVCVILSISARRYRVAYSPNPEGSWYELGPEPESVLPVLSGVIWRFCEAR